MRQFYLSRNRCGYYRVHFVDPVTHVQGVGKSTHTKDKVEATLLAGKWLLEGMPMAMSNSRAFAEGNCPKIPVGGDLQKLASSLSDSDTKTLLELLSKKMNVDLSKVVETVPAVNAPSSDKAETMLSEKTPEPASATPPAKKRYVVIKKKSCETKVEAVPAEKAETKSESDGKLLLCDTLENFWDYDNSEFIQRHIARGHTMSKKHAFCMHAFVKNYWRPYWGDDTTIEDLTKPELDDFFFYLFREKQLAGETVNKVINSASRCTRWLYENNRIKINPLFGIERFKADHAERDIPTEAEMRRLLQLDWENPMALMAFKLGAFCGLRAGEISGLRVCDIDVAEGMLHVRHSYSEVDGLKSTKNKDKRDLPIDNVTALQLMNHARLNPKFNELSYIFWSSKDPTKSTTPGYYADIFYLALEKIGISEAERKDRNIVFHSLRHFCATILAQRTDRNTVMTILGHRTEKVSEHYSDHDTKEKFDNMRNVMQAAWDQYLSA